MLSQKGWDKVTPANVQETVKFDILGDRQLQFTDEAVWYFTQEMMAVPLPAVIATGILVRNKPILYRDVKWVGPIRKKQWGMLALGIPGSAAGLWMTFTNLRQGGGALAVAVIILVLIGLIPLWIFIQGRQFLAIASDKEVICFPWTGRRSKFARRSNSSRSTAPVAKSAGRCHCHPPVADRGKGVRSQIAGSWDGLSVAPYPLVPACESSVSKVS
jgi:hypothetical protein